MRAPAEPTSARERIAFAADLPLPEALAIYRTLQPYVGYAKVGLSLFVEHGPAAVEAFQRLGAKVFLDLKLHDIPNTVELAARRATALGVDLLTVHASGGEAMLQAAVRGAPERILAVTVLTSLTRAALADVGQLGSPEETALRLAGLAMRANVKGLVCSPQELRSLKAKVRPNPFCCTPGIRAAGAERGDQARAEDAATAIGAGSNLLVVGRPLYQAADPERAARTLHDEVDAALKATPR